VLQIHFIALDDVVWELGSPPGHHPAGMTEIVGYGSKKTDTQVTPFT
jgi:hypothetical protein